MNSFTFLDFILFRVYVLEEQNPLSLEIKRHATQDPSIIQRSFHSYRSSI